MLNRQKLSVKNRENKDIAVLLDNPNDSGGVVFIAHGLGAIKEQRQLEECAGIFTGSGYTVVRYDALNSIGEGEGDVEFASVTGYYENLEDVIDWACGQSWYREPFVLLGHSLGGLISFLYAEKYPEKVRGVVAISTGVGGDLGLRNYTEGEIREWQEKGYRDEETHGHPELKIRVTWDMVEDGLKHDARTAADRLTMPVLFIAGEADELNPVADQRELYELIPGKKEFHIIKDGPHTFWEKRHFEEIRRVLTDWIGCI